MDKTENSRYAADLGPLRPLDLIEAAFAEFPVRGKHDDMVSISVASVCGVADTLRGSHIYLSGIAEPIAVGVSRETVLKVVAEKLHALASS